MNKQVESHFATLPSLDISRSIFDRSCKHCTTLNAGELIPIYCQEILPGDSVSMKTNKVIRSQTMLTPLMDNIYAEVTHWFVPMRLVWSHTKEFFGENTSGAWAPEVKYQIPSIASPEGGFASGTLADHFGLPVGVEWSNDAENRPSALPFRAYALICNEFWRDQNLSDPLLIPLDDINQQGSNGSNYITDVANGGMPFIAAKFHDAFTSALPQPQKGDPVTLGFDAVPYGSVAPVHTYEYDFNSQLLGQDPVRWLHSATVAHNLVVSPDANHPGTTATYPSAGNATPNLDYPLQPSNLGVDLGRFGFNINEMRLAFQLQRYLERNARSGTRYVEYLKSHFGVTSPDSRLQRPEYLGGNRFALTVREVTNSAQSEQDFLGDVGAKSATFDSNEDFEHSFTEHGFLISLCVIRYDHSYSQGLDKFWTRRLVTDFYDPAFANLGEVPIDKSELMATAENMATRDTFGYQEAWYDYRYSRDMSTGLMRPGVSGSLASWHLGDYYTDVPTLSDAWIREDKTNVDRVLAVTSQVSPQFWADFYFDTRWTRPMPVYSIPGLIDHN